MLLTKQSLVVAILAFLAAVLVFGVRPIQINHIIKKTLKNQDFINKQYSLKILDEGIEYYTHEDYLINYKWADILFVYELRNYWYFYISEHGAIIIVKDLLDFEKRKELKDFINDFFVPRKKYKKYKK